MLAPRLTARESFKEIFKYFFDQAWITCKTVLVWMVRYFTTLSYWNFIAFLIILLASAVVWFPLFLVTPPLLYVRENQLDIMQEVSSSTSSVNYGLTKAVNAFNKVYHSMRGGIKIYDVVVDWVLFLGLKLYEFFDCEVGNECTPFVELFENIGQLIPFSLSLFWIVRNGIGSAFIPFSVYTDQSPYDFNYALYQNQQSIVNFTLFYDDKSSGQARVLGIDEISMRKTGGHMLLVQKLSDSSIESLRSNNATDRLPSSKSGRGIHVMPLSSIPNEGCTPANPTDCAPPGCIICEPILDVWAAIWNPDVIIFVCEFVKFILDYGITLLKEYYEEAMRYFLPFLKWLLAFVGGDLIGFFSDLFQKVAAFYLWLDTVWTSFLDTFQNTLESISNFFVNLYDTLDAYFDNIVDYIQNKLDSFVDLIAGTLADIVDQLTDTSCDAIEQLCTVCDSVGLCVLDVPSACPNPGQCGNLNGPGDTVDSITNSISGVIGKRTNPDPQSYYKSPNGKYIKSRTAKQYTRRSIYSPVASTPKLFGYSMSIVRDLSIGNITLDKDAYCTTILETGFDYYTFVNMDPWDKFIRYTCLIWVELTVYGDDVAARFIATSSSSRDTRSLTEPFVDDNTPQGKSKKRAQEFRQVASTGMGVLRNAISRIHKGIKLQRPSVISVFNDVQRVTAGYKTSNLNFTFGPEEIGNATEILRSKLKRMMEDDQDLETHNRRSDMGDEPATSFGKFFAQEANAYTRKIQSRVPNHKYESLRTAYEAAAAAPEVLKLQKSWQKFKQTDWTYHYIKSNYPRVDDPNSADGLAYARTKEYSNKFINFVKFVSKQPTWREYEAYWQANVTRVGEDIKLMKNGRDATRSLGKRDVTNDFINWITSGLWISIGDKVLDIVHWFTDCNPLPESAGPGGNPNPNGRVCLPYLDADFQIGEPHLSLDFILPACCSEGFQCPARFNSGFGEIQFVIQITSYYLGIPWNGIIGWVPLIGKPIKGLVTFEANLVPDYGWYCFVVSLGGLTQLLFWMVLAAVFIAAWILPEILLCYCFSQICCCGLVAFCRASLFICNICRPQQINATQYEGDVRGIRFLISSIPFCGCCRPKGVGVALGAQAVLGMFVGEQMPQFGGDGGLIGQLRFERQQQEQQQQLLQQQQQQQLQLQRQRMLQQQQQQQQQQFLGDSHKDL